MKKFLTLLGLLALVLPATAQPILRQFGTTNTAIQLTNIIFSMTQSPTGGISAAQATNIVQNNAVLPLNSFSTNQTLINPANVQGNLGVVGDVTAEAFGGVGTLLTELNASELTSGTIPDARFPAVLPAIDGSLLTGIAGGYSGFVTNTATTNAFKSTNDFSFLFANNGGTDGFSMTGDGLGGTIIAKQGGSAATIYFNGFDYVTFPGVQFGSSVSQFTTPANFLAGAQYYLGTRTIWNSGFTSSPRVDIGSAAGIDLATNQVIKWSQTVDDNLNTGDLAIARIANKFQMTNHGSGYADLTAGGFSSDGVNFRRSETNTPVDGYVSTAAGTNGHTKWAPTVVGSGDASGVSNAVGIAAGSGITVTTNENGRLFTIISTGGGGLATNVYVGGNGGVQITTNAPGDFTIGFGPGVTAAYPPGSTNWVVLCGDSIFTVETAGVSNYLTTEFFATPLAQAAGMKVITNTSTASQKFSQHSLTNEIIPWLTAGASLGIPVHVVLQSGNHDLSSGTNYVDLYNSMSNWGRIVRLFGSANSLMVLEMHNYGAYAYDPLYQKDQFNSELVHENWWDYRAPWNQALGNTADERYTSTDGVHPNAGGVRLIANTINRTFQKGRRNPFPITPMFKFGPDFSGSGQLLYGYHHIHRYWDGGDWGPGLMMQNTVNNHYLGISVTAGATGAAARFSYDANGAYTADDYRLSLSQSNVIVHTNFIIGPGSVAIGDGSGLTNLTGVSSGGATNGIQMLNGFGTNTTLIAPTLDNPTVSGAMELSTSATISSGNGNLTLGAETGVDSVVIATGDFVVNASGILYGNGAGLTNVPGTGGATNGIQMLNGSGTNTTLHNGNYLGGTFVGDGSGLTNLTGVSGGGSGLVIQSLASINTGTYGVGGAARAVVMVGVGVPQTTDAGAGYVWPTSGYITNFWFYNLTNEAAGTNITITLRTNGVSTPFTMTMLGGWGQSTNKLTGSFAVTAGQRINWLVTASATLPARTLAIGAQFVTEGAASGSGSATNVFFAAGQNTAWRVVNGSNVVDVVGVLTNAVQRADGFATNTTLVNPANVEGNLGVVGDVTAEAFSGVGTLLTELNASEVTSGLVAPGRLSPTAGVPTNGTYALHFEGGTNVWKLSQGGTNSVYGGFATNLSTANSFVSTNDILVQGNIDASGVFTGNGSGLTDLNAAEITGTITELTVGTLIATNIYGNGAGLSNTVDLIAGSNITITTNANNRSFTIASTGGGGSTNYTYASGQAGILVEADDYLRLLYTNNVSGLVLTNFAGGGGSVALRTPEGVDRFWARQSGGSTAATINGGDELNVEVASTTLFYGSAANRYVNDGNNVEAINFKDKDNLVFGGDTIQLTNVAVGQALGRLNSTTFGGVSVGGGGGATLGAMRQNVVLWEEFIGKIPSSGGGAFPFGFLFVANNGTAASQGSGEADVPGMITLGTATATNSSPLLYNSVDTYPILFGGGNYTNEWRIRLPTLPTVAEGFSNRIGFAAAQSAAVTADGVYMTFDTNDTHFVLVSRKDNVESRATNTTVLTANTWYKVTLAVLGTTNVVMTVDDADAVSVTSNIPTAGDLVGLICQMVKVAGATSRTLNVDYCGLAYSLYTSR